MATGTAQPEATIRAWFPTAHDARGAIVKLEQAGIETISTDFTTREQPDRHAIDMAAAADTGRHFTVGVTVGALAGGVVFLLIGAVSTGPAWIWGLGGLILGGVAGSFYGVAARLPVNEAAFDTYRPDDAPAVIEVVTARDHVQEAARAISQAHPTRVQVDQG